MADHSDQDICSPHEGNAPLTKLRSRLTYANVASTLALIVALGGGTALAVSRINAAKVDGLNAAKIDFVANANGPNPPFKTVLRQGGLTLKARCVDQSGFFLDAKAKSTKNNAEIQVAIKEMLSTNTDTAYDRDFDRGQTLVMPSPLGGIGEGSLVYSTSKGSHLAVTFQLDHGSVLGGTKACLFAGTALHSPP